MLSFIPLLISRKMSRNSIYKSYTPKRVVHKDKQKLKIDYVYNDQLEEITYIKSYSLFFLSFLDFLEVISLFLSSNLFRINNNVFFWSADILFLYLFSKILLNTLYIHRHHIISLFIFFILIYIYQLQ